MISSSTKNNRTHKADDKKSVRISAEKSRYLNTLELQLLKSKLDIAWKQILALPNEKQYARSVRVTRLLHDHDAPKILQAITPSCSRVFLSKGKLHIEVDSANQIFADPIATVYHHGFLRPSKLGENFIEAPSSIGKFIFNRFPNLVSSVNISDLDKRNTYLNGELENLRMENQLPSFLIYHQARFINCKLHIRETSNEPISEFKSISDIERRALFSSNPKLQNYMALNPHASVASITEIMDTEK